MYKYMETGKTSSVPTSTIKQEWFNNQHITRCKSLTNTHQLLQNIFNNNSQKSDEERLQLYEHHQNSDKEQTLFLYFVVYSGL